MQYGSHRKGEDKMSYQTLRQRQQRKRRLQQRRQFIIITSSIAIFSIAFIGYRVIATPKNSSKPVAEVIATPKATLSVTSSKKEPSKEIASNTSTDTTTPTILDTNQDTKPSDGPQSGDDNPTVNSSTTPEKGKDNYVSYFSDCAFIGDSRTEGLQRNVGLKQSSFFTQRGLMVSTALTSNRISLGKGKTGSLTAGLKQKKYKKIFLMFGVNELGWPYESTFTDKYLKLVESIHSAQPNAKIYIQSIIPVTKAKSDSDSIYNNKRIKSFNAALKKMCKANKIGYIDLTKFAGNDVLPANAATDGVHLTKEYCIKWVDTLKKQLN